MVIYNSKIYSIKGDNNNIKFYKQEYILIKYTAEGVNFAKIDRKKLYKKKYVYDKLYQLFTNFNCAMYEVLLFELPTKIYLDCDFDVNEKLFLENDKIILNLNNYLVSFLKCRSINTNNIVYSDASRKKSDNKYKISLHILINNVYIKNRNLLKKIIEEFKNTLKDDLLYYNSIDTTVYNQPQLFKCVLSPSKDDGTLLIPFIIDNNRIIKYENSYIIENIYDFLVGCYNTNSDDIYIDNDFEYLNKIQEIPKILKNSNIDDESFIENNKRKWIERNFYIKDIYKIRNNKVINNKIDLQRIIPSFCKICDREHYSENAFCKIYNNSIYFHCGRNPKGICIGYWNNKKEHKKNVNEDLYKIIDNLKNYIKDVDNNYNKLKEEYKIYKRYKFRNVAKIL